MLKRALSLVLVLMIFAAVPVVHAVGFRDVTSSYSWAEEAIESLADSSIINGYPDGTFKPGNQITKEEAISLFARMLGSSETLNESVITLSNLLFEDVKTQYDTYAKEAAAYLVYKKVLVENDLATYLSSANKGQPLKRYEAATLIAKCLGGDVWLKTNPDITLSFADAASVPASAKGYVYFASEAGVMQGMEDNKFEPMGNVTRAQIAVMIHRIFSQMNYTYTKGIITQINASDKTITISDDSGVSETYVVNSSVAVMLDGEQSQLSSLSVGQEIIVTFSNEALYSLDVVAMAVDDTIEAIFKGKSTDTKGTKIKVAPMDSSETVTYSLADDVVISRNGESASLNSLVAGDHLIVTIASGKVTFINAKEKTKIISGGRVESITFEPDVVIGIRTSGGELVSCKLAEGATIRKNNQTTTFSALVVGDKVDATLEYEKIVAVTAIGIEKTISGDIEEITISKTNSSLVLNNGKTSTRYAISRNVEILLDDREATLYDLRIGYEVELVTSSSTITKVKVKSVASPLQITGRIVLINTTYNMLVVEHTDVNGNIAEKNVFLNSAKILDSNDGKIKTIKNLSVGQNVTIAGAENLGVFEASSLMILSNAQ